MLADEIERITAAVEKLLGRVEIHGATLEQIVTVTIAVTLMHLHGKRDDRDGE